VGISEENDGKKMCFAGTWIDIIIKCISTVCFLTKVNRGKESPLVFQSSKMVSYKQPLHEALQRMIEKFQKVVHESDKLHGPIKITPGA
jgi:hypothetical protein